MERYQAELDSGQLQPDAEQLKAVEHTERLYHALLHAQRNDKSFLAGLARVFGVPKREPLRGLYLWGGVGRGKTHLVNAFFAALPFGEKQRVHFHSFMQLVHARLAALNQRQDPLAHVASHLAAEARVVCFDEFHVADITDAMLLGRLLRGLFGHGVTLVATSNIAPDELYRDGLQREQFLPAIELIKKNTEVVHLASEVDYRLRVLERAEIYHYPLDEQAEAGLAACFEALGPENVRTGEQLRVAGRAIDTKRLADGIVWLDFAEICETPRSAADYIHIARCYHTVLVSDVPRMDDEQLDRVVRFIHLVDELYERNVNLVVSAAAPPDELYSGDRLAERFARAESRLMEMQSRDYLAAKHLP